MATGQSSNRYVSQSVDQWAATAVHEMDDIRSWRHDIQEKFFRSPFEPEPLGFGPDTAWLVSWIASELPNLDASPLQMVYAAVSTWHRDHSAERLAEQRELDAALDQALVLVYAARNTIHRCQDDPSEDSGQANGQKKKTLAVLPRNDDVARLARKINAEYVRGRNTKREIAEDFTSGDKDRAATLLRQLRSDRFGNLLNNADK